MVIQGADEQERAALICAAAENHTEWFAAKARVAGGEAGETDGVRWAVSPLAMTIAFPRLTSARAGSALDAIMAECFARKPQGASCWSLVPTRPRDLGARIAARGFEWGWRPHWMARNLRSVLPDLPAPDGLQIAMDDEGDWEVDDLPYYSREDAAGLRAMARETPRRLWHFVARRNGQIVGHSVLFVTAGQEGAAGIYNVGVVPSARGQGIGAAVSLAACRFAQALGCRTALLNSAADRLYERLGFVSLGYGQTWWMHAPTLAAPPPTPDQIAFAEAIGRGDVPALDALNACALPDDLDAPLPNGMTPMALAVRARKSAAAGWLAAHGATLEVLHAWDLGWKARARRLLADSPALANQRMGAWQITPLHEAVYRGDMALACLLLTAHPDLEIADTEFHSTPLGWARHFGNAEMVALLDAISGLSSHHSFTGFRDTV